MWAYNESGQKLLSEDEEDEEEEEKLKTVKVNSNSGGGCKVPERREKKIRTTISMTRGTGEIGKEREEERAQGRPRCTAVREKWRESEREREIKGVCVELLPRCFPWSLSLDSARPPSSNSGVQRQLESKGVEKHLGPP